MKSSAVLAVVALAMAGPLAAQDAAGPQSDAEWMEWVPDPAEIEMPALDFTEDASAIDDYEKYYYFNRQDTSFADALADLRTCDAHARGLWRGNYYVDPLQNPAYVQQYGPMASAVGGLIAGAMLSAIVGSSEERRKRRVNMRRCMFYMGYQRYGLTKELWEAFNFEEGNNSVPEEERQRLLARQALVASGPRPETTELGL